MIDRRFILSLAVLCVGTFFACPRLNNPAVDNAQLLIGCWMHSYEEETAGGVKIYRPCDYQTFPPSRFRDFFELKSEGECDYAILAPNDAHSARAGRWNYNESIQEIEFRDETGTIIRTIQIENLESELLEITE